MRREKTSFGFTLMEMLVALVMAGAVMAPLYFITRGVAEQTGSKQMEIEAMQRARVGMDTLIRDFSRVGLFTSPNTAADPRFLNREQAGSNARYRPAAVHLNADSSGADSVMLAGNFLGSNMYRAYVTGTYTVEFIDAVSSEEECTRQFNPSYAFLHISDGSGRELDAKVDSVTYTSSSSGCQVTIDSGDYNAQSFKTGDTVFVSANQTLVYRVENESLIRYFAAYESPSSENSGVCDPSTAGGALDLVEGTRQVVANFVEDFQVWFRPVTDEAGWSEPHYHPVTDIISENEGNFADGLTPSETSALIPLEADGTVSSDSVTCAALETEGTTVIGPERIRSALIRLTVRSEKSEASIRRMPDDDATRLEKRLLAADSNTATASGEDPYAYLLRTVTTEVEMPNLAARSDLL